MPIIKTDFTGQVGVNPIFSGQNITLAPYFSAGNVSRRPSI